MAIEIWREGMSAVPNDVPEAAEPPVKPKGVSVGRIVHFQTPYDGCRAALIVKVWGEPSNGCVNLAVFLDGLNDETLFGAVHRITDAGPSMMAWRTSVLYDTIEKKPYTWHFPEYVE